MAELGVQAVIDEAVVLNRYIPVPLYYQLKQYIVGKIESSDWGVGSIIPTEQSFCNEFSISRPTVRQAINELVAEGSLTRGYRKVTVAKPKVAGSFFNVVQSFNAEMAAKNLTPKTRILTLGVKENSEASEKLGIPTGNLVCLERLRFADDEPIVWVETYLKYDSMSDLLSLDFTDVSLYAMLEERYNITISRVDRMFEASAADSRDSELLDVRKGSPICFVKTMSYDQKDNPVEFSVARYRGDKSTFHVSILK
ncbi:MAG: GntR family transcriptional regulator [Oscillospiraceae bacterium]|nr:GntR family transcriptional regulator [Oscillospiraceae bacterium]